LPALYGRHHEEDHDLRMDMKAPLLADQIRREYQDMTGLKLTVQQIRASSGLGTNEGASSIQRYMNR
jgi:hypothetical protein